MMAAFSIYTSVIILFVMGALTVISLIRSGQVQRAASVATFIFAASIPPVLATRSISEPGKPLYGAADFLGVFSSSYSLLSPASPVLSIAVAICLCIPFFMKLSDRSKMLLLILVLTLFIFYVAAFFAGRPLPTGRVLLPLIPIFLLASVSAWDDLLKQQELSDRFNFRTLTFNSVRILVLVVLTLSFILSFRFDDTHDWKGNRVNPEDLMQSIKNGECSVLRKYHPSITFYQRKWQDNIDSQCSDK